jgi:alpha-1,3-glucan synthase
MMLDIDGFRIDKATQVTVDALGDFSQAMRECAASVGKNNFFISGEISGGNDYGSIFVGRGRQPDMQSTTALDAVTMTNASNSSLFIRDQGKNGLDSAAFHYSIYRSLTRFLGMDGIIEGPYDTPVNLVQAWDTLLMTNDLVNPSTGVFDPRHMFGTTNQDNFRWPAVAHGTEKMLLGQFLTTLQMPGIPLLLWGEEQAFYVLDSTADNYIFGRQAMSPAQAWKLHGCYTVGSSQFPSFLEGAPAATGCSDDWNTFDHRDPSSPIRNIIRSMYQMRKNYPALNDGYLLQQLSNQTHEIFLPASNGTATEIGIFSTMRSNFGSVQDLSGTGQGNQSVWLVYHNDNTTVDYEFNCTAPDFALISPFDTNTTVKNLFYPFDEVTLIEGPVQLGINGSSNFNGCLNNMTLAPWEYRAYVPIDNFVAPGPMITQFLPGHDARILSSPSSQNGTIPIELHFSTPMDCSSVTSSITIQSTTEDSSTAVIDPESVVCSAVQEEVVSPWFGSLPTVWTFQATLSGVSDGVHVVTVTSPVSENSTVSTQSTDHFFLRIGQSNNPITFPESANYTTEFLHRSVDGDLFVSHNAAGADQFRYSLDWGSTYSPWQTYVGGDTALVKPKWNGTKEQRWDGEHVIVQYFSSALGTSDHIQHGDYNYNRAPRRFPHLFVQGEFNNFGTDAGFENAMSLSKDGQWEFDLMAEWPIVSFQVNEWGLDPNGQPDQTALYGDVDGDKVLDRLPPSSLAPATLKFWASPPSPFLTWKLSINDATLGYEITPSGNRWLQLIAYILMWTVPVLTGTLGAFAYLQSFYRVKFNKIGIPMPSNFSLAKIFRRKNRDHRRSNATTSTLALRHSSSSTLCLPTVVPPPDERTVLIATMEYDISDWAIKIKIGGLGVMAQLMGQSLEHQKLIWVVPCVGGIEYPIDKPADSMEITIMGKPYQIQVQYHKLCNITYVLLDAPMFRARSKADPYPERMDDMESAIYYSAWNQCIAEAIRRFQPDLYHINDYHGALAPVHLLPDTIPCVLSLHNAEFQGLWGMRTPEELKEVCEVFNITPEVAQKYVQFGDVFNLLHAGASYLRIHQKGFGAVGVSKKYGKRSWSRYPIFWGLSKIGQLPNPDPTDLAKWTGQQDQEEIVIDEAFEKTRGDLRVQAQKWAGLNENPNAELLVFVGRWSMQKGIDLIADAMPALLEDNQNVQLICVGPVIDLYGKFAALKLDVLMKQYPGRVFSKPEFTALPPFIFSGAEFALIPSRDEPFGLVAVEFGRKGALGIGARVGGLGQMPGWWFTVESTTTSHLLHQFKRAIKDALASNTETRKELRARSAKQRFPVAQWVADLEELQGTAIGLHCKESTCSKCERSSRTTSKMPARASRVYMDNSRCSSIGSRVSFPDPYRRSQSYDRTRPTTAVSSMTNLTRPASTLNAGQRSSSYNDLELLGNRRRSPLADAVVSAVQHDSSNDFSPENSPYLRAHSRPPGEIGNRRSVSSQSLLALPQDPMSRRFAPGSEEERRISQEPPWDPEDFLPPLSFYQLGNVSTLSLEDVVGDKNDFSLQKVDPSFTDSTEEYYNDFKAKLRTLSPSNSESALCIEDFLVKSEKAWFSRFRDAKLGKKSLSNDSRVSSPFRLSRSSTPRNDRSRTSSFSGETKNEFLLSESYCPPRGIRKYLQYKIGEWPLYTLLLGLGQIMAANSYQITLLAGPKGQNSEKIYTIAGVYLAASILWWFCYRLFKSVYVLSLPFVLYGLSLLLLGVVPFFPHSATVAIQQVQNVATGVYTFAAASGSLYFALNFGDEGGTPVKTWVYRACVIQGTQQVYITALWYWGAHMTSSSTLSHTMAYILLPLGIVLLLISLLLFLGLPSYYRQTPGNVPSLFASLFRRKIVIWFFITVLIQNFFLSTLTGRNWGYLWSSTHVKNWQIAVLAIGFFVIIWTTFLYFFGLLAKTHTWILPIFAIGLGAPRWVQILWSCTPWGQFLPWAGSPLASALLGRSLWLWLGVLDALQGVGFGMILLQTLTRIHISATLIGAQILGVSITAIAHAVGPSQLGPGSAFPDFSRGAVALSHPWFWVGLGFQLVICIGFFKFFRKEQLSKP